MALLEIRLRAQIDDQRVSLSKQKAEYDALVKQMQDAIDSQAAVRNQAAADRNTLLLTARQLARAMRQPVRQAKRAQ